MIATQDRLIDEYLQELRKELSDLPRASRQEVLDEIEEHIAAARAESGADGEVAIRNVLERLGDPAVIAKEARERFGVQRRQVGFLEIAALVLLAIGGIFVGIGWVLGLILLWSSNAWTAGQKAIGTVFTSTSFFLVFLLTSVTLTTSCPQVTDVNTGRLVHGACVSQGPSTAANVAWIFLFVVLGAAPIITAVWLWRQMRKPAVNPA